MGHFLLTTELMLLIQAISAAWYDGGVQSRWMGGRSMSGRVEIK